MLYKEWYQTEKNVQTNWIAVERSVGKKWPFWDFLTMIFYLRVINKPNLFSLAFNLNALRLIL